MAHALDIYADALYWQASETAEWALTNNFSTSDQIISYKSIDFNSAPGFRAGLGLHNKDWGSRFLYTYYYVRANDSITGNVISAFELGKFTQIFSKAAQVNFAINFNMFDADLYKTIPVGEDLTFRPVFGVKGGWINQSINTHFQGQLNYQEMVTNNFYGAGPKIGIESQWAFYQKNNFRYSLVANFASAFLWGNWTINDSLKQSNLSRVSNFVVGKRDFGALTVDGRVGLNVDYKNYLLTVAYEASDWFNQYQAFDNSTGARSNDLILQGLTIALSHRW